MHSIDVLSIAEYRLIFRLRKALGGVWEQEEGEIMSVHQGSEHKDRTLALFYFMCPLKGVRMEDSDWSKVP